MASKLYDVLIIGGGPAGLAIASGLARQVYSALIIDSGVYRNARANHMHNVPGFDHAPPSEYRAKLRDDLTRRYKTIDFQTAKIAEVRKLDSGIFEAVDDKGAVYQGKKLGLATGVRDMVELEAEGYDDCWGRGIFHCLFCHGYEERGAASSGILVSGMLSAPDFISHVFLMAKRLSGAVTIYTNSNPSVASEMSTRILGTKMHIDDRAITRFSRVSEDSPEVTITFADGTTKTEGFIASQPKLEQASPFAAQLGLEMTETGDVKVTPPFNETSVPGCFAAGDAANMFKAVGAATTQGSFAAVGLVGQLARELAEKDEL